MPTVTNLTQAQVNKIQIDEGLIYIDYGTANERKLAPTRGGGEFTATQTIRDIEFDGRVGKTAGMQVIESQEASLKVNTLCCSQKELQLALPGCRVSGSGDAAVIKNAKAGVMSAAVGSSVYCSNVTMFAKLMDGKFKKITIFNPANEGALSIKAVQKAENELALEIYAHYTISDLNGDLYQIEEVTSAESEAALSSLTIGDLVLSPSFSSGQLEYEAATTAASDKITAAATASAATIAIKNGSTTVTNGSAASWSAGENTVTVTVTNGTNTRTYTVVVTKS